MRAMKTNKLLFLAALMLTFAAAARNAPEADHRTAVAAQSSAFMHALERGDAGAAAALFTADAKLIVPAVDGVVTGRSAIQDFWQAGLSNGVKGLQLTTLDLDGNGQLLIETGTYQALGAGGRDLGQGHYLFVWKNDNGIWRIHRDIASAKPVTAVATAGGGSDGSRALYRRSNYSRGFQGQNRGDDRFWHNCPPAVVRHDGFIPDGTYRHGFAQAADAKAAACIRRGVARKAGIDRVYVFDVSAATARYVKTAPGMGVRQLSSGRQHPARTRKCRRLRRLPSQGRTGA